MKKILSVLCLTTFLCACADNHAVLVPSLEQKINQDGGAFDDASMIPDEMGGKSSDVVSETTGVQMDVLARRIRKEVLSSGVQVKQDQNKVILIMPVSAVFGTNQATIQTSFDGALQAITKLLQDYDQTMIQIVGYTDNSGVVLSNRTLSLRRAHAVSNYLRAQGIDVERIYVDGKGPQDPIANNATPEGRAQNQRVELTIYNLK